MKKALLLLPALCLAACNNTSDKPDIPETINTETALKMHEPRQLTTDLKGEVTWTSSQPEVISVDANGNVTGLRLTAEPVTITASSSQGKQTVQLNTFGLELSMCTFNDNILMKNAGKLRLCALTKFRTEEGAIPDNATEDKNYYPVQILDPSGEAVNINSNIFPAEDGNDAWVSYNTKLFPEAGVYTASVDINGEVYSASAVLDPEDKAEGINNADIELTSNTYEIKGEFGEGTGAVWPWCLRTADRKAKYLDKPHTALPAAGNHNFDVNGSNVRCDIVSYTVDPLDFSKVTPQQVNMAWQQGKVFKFD